MIEIMNNFIKIFFISIYSFIGYFKITNKKYIFNIKNTIIVLISNCIIGIIYLILINKISNILINIIVISIQGNIIAFIVKEKNSYCIVAELISYILAYSIYIIAVVITGVIMKILKVNILDNNIINLIVILGVMFFILKIFFNIKRFKNGFYFLQYKENISNIGNICVLFCSFVLIVGWVLKKYEDTIINIYTILGTILLIIIFTLWIKRQITKQYKSNMKDRTIELQQEEIASKDKIIEELKEKNIKFSEIIHKYNNRFSALENAILNKLENNNIEASNELGIMLEDLKKMSSNFSNEVVSATKSELPKTNILSIDSIFKYMSECAVKDNIKFNLKINNNIDYLINNIITKEELETIIGDHIKDAIIAINSSNNKNREIMVILGIVDNAYELCIYDTGIEFQIKTLQNLGLKRITTHENEGGTGIGFMTTFATLNKCNGSLIIEEYNKENYYTKAVTIRFDNKKEYKIKSYRKDTLQEEIKDKRIILE